MIHYHGGPVTPLPASLALWQRRHACVSFAWPTQINLAAEVCQSFILDNGAYTFWRAGKGRVDVAAYAAWVQEWERHPGFDWCLIPDAIDGDENENDRLIAEWFRHAGRSFHHGVPVWHLHESIGRLTRLCHNYRRVALGSSGEYAEPNRPGWWQRIGEAMDVICDDQGRPPCRLHGLRMLNPTVFSQLPLASADSTSVAQNIGIDQKWRGAYAPLSAITRALVLADRIEHHASAARWTRTFGTQMNMDLVG